jgi:hypothetical protein
MASGGMVYIPYSTIEIGNRPRIYEDLERVFQQAENN